MGTELKKLPFGIQCLERLRERAKNARAEFLPISFPHLHLRPTPRVSEVTTRSLSQWPRFEKDRELEDAIIRKRKSQLVPPQRDTETRARKLCL